MALDDAAFLAKLQQAFGYTQEEGWTMPEDKIDDQGRKIRISDWEHDRSGGQWFSLNLNGWQWGWYFGGQSVDCSYTKMSQLAAQVSQAGPWPLMDRGPSQALLAESPRKGQVRLGTEDWSIVGNLLGILGFLVWAWFVFPDIVKHFASR